MKKVLVFAIIFIISMFSFDKASYANQMKSFEITETNNTKYTYQVAVFSDNKDDAIIGRPLKKYWILINIYDRDDHLGPFNPTWDNPDYVIKAGEQYVSLSGYFGDELITLTMYLYGIKFVDPDSDVVPEEPAEPEESDEPTTPSLTATTVLLTNATTYDINLNDKIPGSTYKWTSSDTKVAKVNSKNGLVTAVSEGTATITCEITPPDGEIIKLQSVVTIGYDDNAPNLSDTSLDLGIGDKYTLKAENTLAKSNIRFTTSDKSIVKVGTANGKATAVSAGEAYITCTITAGGQVIVLRCDVTVTE